MKPPTPLSVYLAAAWCLAVILRFGIPRPVGVGDWVFRLVADGWLRLSGVVVGIAILALWIRLRDRRHLFALGSVGIVGWLAYGVGVGPDVELRIRFHRLQPEYVEIVSRVQLGEIESSGVYQGIRYQSDPSEPLRIAFVWDGLVDNWHGVVFDPTGLVLRANEFKPDWSNWEAPELQEVKHLFGGDMLYARHLGGPWYLCGFT